jgi:ribonuclease J
MRICVHRGAEEIGGNCIELEAQGKRLVLDLGRPLDSGFEDEVPLTPVPGLAKGDDPTLLGVVISHPHLDHWGLVPQIAPSVPVYIGEAAHRLLKEAAFFSPAGADLGPAGFLHDRRPFALGPFTVTPYLMDHSAFDAHALLVEADGERLFYTGDFRGHGRKAALFERLLRDPPKKIDLLLTEGTNVRPEGEPSASEVTEREVELQCIEAFKATPGIALVAYSAQNIDRLVTLYRATLEAGRDFVMDLYTATIAEATGNEHIPRPGAGWPRVRLYVPLRQSIQVKESREFERVAPLREYRIFGEELADRSSRFVMTFRGSMARELEKAGALDGASLIWSLWDRYLDEDRSIRRLREHHPLPIRTIHASGHAYASDLRRLQEKLAPRRAVTIHTLCAEAGVRNGAWFQVANREAQPLQENEP